MEHYNRYQQTRFRGINDQWRQNQNRENEEIYHDNLKFNRERYHDPRLQSYPLPYAKDFAEHEFSQGPHLSYNDPSYYQIKRKEFGHGQSGNMNPGRMEDYGETSFRGFTDRSNLGRDYETNAGYRENYNNLDNRPGPGYEYEFAQLRRQQMPSRPSTTGPHKGKGPRSYKRTDDRILDDINDRMCDNPYLDASDIEVGVKDGEVVLTGTVDDREAKRMAADISENVSGVENVENRLHVKIKGV
jgi:hypothetical protein